jgi:hypothetical protein
MKLLTLENYATLILNFSHTSQYFVKSPANDTKSMPDFGRMWSFHVFLVYVRIEPQKIVKPILGFCVSMMMALATIVQLRWSCNRDCDSIAQSDPIAKPGKTFSFFNKKEPPMGLEPTTRALRMRCSTD